MRSTVFLFIVLVGVFIGLSLAVADTEKAVEKKSAPTPVVETKSEEVCDVTGKILKITKAIDAPLGGALAPSKLTEYYTEVFLHVDDRTTHIQKNPDGTTAVVAKGAPEKSRCKLRPRKKDKPEVRSYRLCSPTKVKAGDRVLGTEATGTGAASARGCLFDVVVLSKKA